MRKIIRSETSYSEPVSFDLEVYTMLKREDLDYLEKEIASLKELVVQATPYVEYAVTYSTPLSQKLSEDWLEKTQERREK